MFEKASRMKLRFSYKGLVSVEDLWDLSVEALDQIFKNLNSQLKEQKEESLLNTKSAADKVLELQVEIIKHIVKVKLEEAEARENKALKAEKKQMLLKIKAERQNNALFELPDAELDKLISDLD